jgi:isoleucyl-tRNA synthetase
VAAKIATGENVDITVNGISHQLTPEEVLVHTEPAEGLAVAADQLLTVAVDAVLTPELKAEGLAREIVRRIQAQRKNADFNIEDRITTWYQGDEAVMEVFQAWGEYIQAETLTTDLRHSEPPQDAHQETHTVDDLKFTVGIRQN